MAGKSFYEVLESQIRAELRAEFEAQYQDQMRAPSRETSAASPALEGAQGRLETWLVSHVEKTHFSRDEFARRAYGTSASRAHDTKARHSQRTMPALTAQTVAGRPFKIDHTAQTDFRYEARSLEDLCLVELMRRQGAELSDSFTAQELKTAWRKVALKTHPDRFTQADPVTQKRMAERFREITEAYGELAARFEAQTKQNPLAA